MAFRGVLFCAIVLYCLCYDEKVEGGHVKLSRKEDLEVEKQPKLLNKPAVKTIKTESGDIYDCIDFYKQPAFDHPLLKNHTYHYDMRPISPSKKMRYKEPTGVGKPLEIGLQGEGCPIGTVPIRRTTKEDLIKAKTFTDTYASRFNPLTVNKPGLLQATIRTKLDPGKKFNGGGARISIYQPSVTGTQYSSGQMTIRGGDDSIQVGWTVNPSLYGDSKSRFFIFLKAGTSVCFNTQCPGFIIVNTHIPLDSILPPTTRGADVMSEVNVFVYRDPLNENWWLEVGPNFHKVGFWPSRIFTGLKDLATYVDWGGEAYSPPGQPGPGMGSGYFPTGTINLDGFCRIVTTINEAHDPVDAENTETYADDYSYYGVKDLGIRGEDGHMMSFGGPEAS